MDDIRQEMEQKYGREAYVNMDRLSIFMARMIKKYGPEVLKEIEEENNSSKIKKANGNA